MHEAHDAETYYSEAVEGQAGHMCQLELTPPASDKVESLRACAEASANTVSIREVALWQAVYVLQGSPRCD
jgi:hypothetical protein